MQPIEYQTTITDNGQIPLPQEIRNRLLLKPNQKIKVIIKDDLSSKTINVLISDVNEKKSSGLCGIWEDDREADEIVEELRTSRSLGRECEL